MSAAFILNSSHIAGCMRRSPASHCCQLRHVECTSAPAAVWVSAAPSRAAFISDGSGLEGFFWPLFGWLLILDSACSAVNGGLYPTNVQFFADFDSKSIRACLSDIKSTSQWDFKRHRFIPLSINPCFPRFSRCGGFNCVSHFHSPASVTRGAVVSEFAGVDELYTRIERICKKYFFKKSTTNYGYPKLFRGCRWDACGRCFGWLAV